MFFYDANDPNELRNPDLVTPHERYHNNHIDKNCSQYKLLGIYIEEFLSLDAHKSTICRRRENLRKALIWERPKRHRHTSANQNI
jgi:hypothetical protein